MTLGLIESSVTCTLYCLYDELDRSRRKLSFIDLSRGFAVQLSFMVNIPSLSTHNSDIASKFLRRNFAASERVLLLPTY